LPSTLLSQLELAEASTMLSAVMDPASSAYWIVDQLTDHFGRIHEPERDPIETLVLTILSQNTTDTNRDRAFASLIERYKSLDAVAQAPQEEIADAIRIGGLQSQKSRSIRAALDCIREEQGELSIDHLSGLDLGEAMAWLLRIPGVGKKTAGIVCLFSFGLPFFPIDTHIRRVLTRFGWIAGNSDPHPIVNEMLPKDPQLMANLHLLVIHLGRTLCSPREPKCEACPLQQRCTYGKGSEK